MATYSLKDASRWLKVLSKGMEGAARKGLLAAAQRTVAHIQNEIIPATTPLPVARGVYRAGWRAEAKPDGALIINDVPHATFIEGGVAAGRVKVGRAMIDALAEWVRMKGIGGSVSTTKGGRQKVTRATESEARQIAWAVAMSLKKRGIFDGGRGLRILKRAEAEIPRFIREEVRRELARAGMGR